MRASRFVLAAGAFLCRRKRFARIVGALAALTAMWSAMSSSFAHLRAENRPKMQSPFVLRTWGSASRRARAGGLFVIRPFAETRLARKRAVRVFLRKTRARVHKTRGHCIFGRFSQRTCAKLGNLARVSASARLPVPGQSASAQRSGHRIASLRAGGSRPVRKRLLAIQMLRPFRPCASAPAGCGCPACGRCGGCGFWRCLRICRASPECRRRCALSPRRT